MEDKQPRDINTGMNSGQSQAIGGMAAAPSLSLPPDPPQTTVSARRKPFNWTLIATVVTVLALIGFGVAAVVVSKRNAASQRETRVAGVVDRYDAQKIDLSDIYSPDGVNLSTSQALSVNGQLRTNGSLVLTPADRPDQAVAGQIYYDKATNSPFVYNGEAFQSVVTGDVVRSIGGVSGQIVLGAGLLLQNGQLSLSQDVVNTLRGASSVGVTSLQGRTGDISLTAGGGIAINGATITNTGVRSLQAASPQLTVTAAGNGVFSIGTVGNLLNGSGTTGQIAVFTGSGALADSLLSQSGGTIFVNGGLQVVGQLQADTITNLTAGQALTLSAGSGQVVFVSEGRSFQLPSTGGVNQTICTVGMDCTNGGGGTYVQLQPGTIQNDSGGGTSIFVNNSGGGNLIQLQGNGLDAFSVANNGDTSVSGNMSVVGTINGATISGGNISGGTVNGATITGGVLSGGTLSAIAVNGLGVTATAISGSGNLTISAANDQNLMLLTSGTGVVSLGTAQLQGVGALAVAAGGVDQNLTLSGSGTGSVVVNTPRFIGPNGASYAFAATDPNSVNAVICTSVGNCSGGSGGLGGSGTPGTIAVFDGIGLSVSNSILSQSGGVVTVAGDLVAANLQGNGAAITNVDAAQLGGQNSAYYTNASNINTGTLSDLRVSANVAKYNDSTANFTGALQQNGNAVCTTAGNCAGTGAGVGGSGTDGVISIWTGGGFSLTNSILSQAGATITASGNVVADNLAGNGSGLTSLNASNIASGTLSDARLSSNVTLQGNVVNAANGLVRLGASGQLPALNASQLTDLHATALTTGTVSDARLSNNVALLNALANFTGASLQFNGNNVCTTAGNCAGTGAGLGGSGTAGTIAVWTGSGFTLGDSLLTQGAGVVTVSGDLIATNLQGNGSAVTGVNAAQLGGNAAGYYTNATNISSGTLSDARLSTNVTRLGNSINVANGLVQLNASGQLPSLNGSLLTNLNASNISSGTLADARLSSNVAFLNAPANFTGTSLRLNGNDVCTTAGNCVGSGGAVGGSGTVGTLALWDGAGFSLADSLVRQSGATVTVDGNFVADTFAGNGSGLFGLNAANISSGTLSDARLTTNVTLQGNIVNTANGLVRLNASGQLPALDGSQLTALNATNIGSGVLSDLRLSGNVALLNSSANFTGAILQFNGDDVCTTAGNCVGGGGGGVGSGTGDTIAIWSSSGTTLTDSLLSQSAGRIVLSGNATLMAGGANQTLTLSGNGTGGVAIMVPTFQNASGASYSFNASETGSHVICTTAGNCIGSGGGVGGSGTSGTIALWNGNSFTLGDSLLSQSGGTVTVAGDLVATNLQGNGSAISSVDAITLDGLDSIHFLNASNLNTGTLGDARLSSNVTVAGNTFNGANQLVRLNGTGQLPALDGSLLTNVNAATLNGNAASYYTDASNLSSGTVSDARLSGNVALLNAASQTFSGNINVTGALRQNGNDVCTTAGNCLGSGGAISGSGTPGSIAIWTGSGFSVGDSILSQSATTVTVTGDLAAANLQGSGSAITDLNATNINTGTLADARLSANVTVAGNVFNGANQLVRLDSSGQLPAVSGVLVTNLNASNIASGTLTDGRLSSNVALYNAATANFTGTLQQNGSTVCTMAGNCVGTSGGAIGGSGTANTLAMFDGTGYTVANSMVSQNVAGTLLSVSGQLSASGGALLGDNSVIIGTLSGLTGLTSSGAVTFSGLNAPGVVHTNGSGLLSTSLITNADLQGGAYGAITGTGALASGSIASGFGAISTTNNITTTAMIQGASINATAAIMTGGTQRINSSGALINIGGYSQTSGLFVVNASAASVAATSLDITAPTNIAGGLFVSSGNTVLQNTTISSGNQFTNHGSTLNSTLYLGGRASSSPIGDAVTTVDVRTTISIGQLTAGLTLSLPNPTATAAGRIVYILNSGSASFTMHGVSISPGYGQTYIWNGSAWIPGNAPGGSTISLQGAYDGGNVINTTDARSIMFTLSDTAADADFITNIASGSTGRFRVQGNGVDVMSIGATGQLILGAQGAGGGVAIGGDTSVYRSGVNRMQMSNALTVRNTTDTASAFQVQTASGNDILSVNTAAGNVSIGASMGGTAKLSINNESGVVWTAANAAQANHWEAIAYGNNVFVAVASDGVNKVMTSSDGTTWTARTAAGAGAETWISVAYGKGLFVAVALSGEVMTSPDGITWTVRTAPSGLWRSVTYGGGQFVAVAGGGTNRIMTSPDGITWTVRTAPEANVWRSVTYGNGVYVAVASSGANRVMTSPDGVTWAGRDAGTGTRYGVTFGRNQFVAVGSGNVATSPDGITWTERTAPATGSWQSVTYGNGLYVAVSEGSSQRIMTSPDGITWTARTPTEYSGWEAVTYGSRMFVAVAGDGTNRVMTSPDTMAIATKGHVEVAGDALFTGNARFRSDGDGASTFAVQTAAGASVLRVDTAQKSVVVGSVASAAARLHIADAADWKLGTATQANNWESIAYGNGLFVAVSSNGTNRVMTSPDGITWTARAAAEQNGWSSVTFGGGQFVAVSSNGTNRVMTSPDGITWTARAAAEANAWNSVTYGGGQFVAVASSGTNRVMTSPDGITWTARTPAEANAWQSVVYGNGVFVAVANNSTTNRAMTSPDGITWTARTPAASAWEAITFANGMFVATAAGGTNRIATTPDGITWTSRTVPVLGQWRDVAYGNGYFTAVSYAGGNRIVTSPDGITWTAQATVGDAGSWTGVAYGAGRFVAVGDSTANRVMYTSVAGLDKAMLVQDPAGTDVLSVDTVTHTVTVSNLTVGANGIIRIVGGDATTRPANPGEGAMYFDTAAKKLLYFADGQWKSAGQTNSTITVATSTSRGKDGADFVVSAADEATGNADATIATAIASLPAVGGTVYLMEGTYTIDNGIVLPGNINFVGAGRGSTIIRFKNAINTNINMFDTPGGSTKPNISISGLQLVGNKANQTAGTQNALSLNRVGSGSGSTAQTGFTIRDLEIKDFYGNGVVETLSPNSLIENVVIRNNNGFGIQTNSSLITMRNIEAVGNGGNGINVTGGQDVTIDSARVTNNTGNGIGLSGTGTKNVSITDSAIRSNTGLGISVQYQSSLRVTSNQIVGNGSHGMEFGGAINYSYAGVVVSNNTISGNTGSGISVNRHVMYATINANRIFSNTIYGIDLSSTLDNPRQNTVTGNFVYDNATGGIRLGGAMDTTVEANTISDNGGATTNQGIVVTHSTTQNNNIIGNTISDSSCTTSCFAIQVTNGARATYISNNTIGAGQIDDTGLETTYANQRDHNGNTINKTQGGFSLNSSVVDSSFSLQGSMKSAQLPAPAQPNVTRPGVNGSTNYGYRVVAVDGTGTSLPSPERIATSNVAALSASNYATVSWAEVPGAVSYYVFRTTSTGTPSTTGRIATVPAKTLSVNDTGLPVDGYSLPTSNTTGGAIIAGGIQAPSIDAASPGGVLSIAGTNATTIEVATNAAAHTISIGTGAATQTISIGSATGASVISLLAGSGGVGVTSDAVSAFKVQTAGGTALLNVDSAAQKVTVQSLEVTYNVTVNGHIISGGAAPTVSFVTSNGVCDSATAVMAVEGTDTAGKITLTTGTGACSVNPIATITYSSAYSKAPVVTMTPASSSAAEARTYVAGAAPYSDGTKFTFGTLDTLTPSTQYIWYYHVIE